MLYCDVNFWDLYVAHKGEEVCCRCGFIAGQLHKEKNSFKEWPRTDKKKHVCINILVFTNNTIVFSLTHFHFKN